MFKQNLSPNSREYLKQRAVALRNGCTASVIKHSKSVSLLSERRGTQDGSHQRGSKVRCVHRVCVCGAAGVRPRRARASFNGSSSVDGASGGSHSTSVRERARWRKTARVCKKEIPLGEHIRDEKTRERGHAIRPTLCVQSVGSS